MNMNATIEQRLWFSFKPCLEWLCGTIHCWQHLFHLWYLCIQVVRKLRASFKSGKTRPIEFRKQQLQRLYDLLKENKDDIIGAMQEDLRKVKAGVIGTGCVCGGGRGVQANMGMVWWLVGAWIMPWSQLSVELPLLFPSPPGKNSTFLWYYYLSQMMLIIYLMNQNVWFCTVAAISMHLTDIALNALTFGYLICSYLNGT